MLSQSTKTLLFATAMMVISFAAPPANAQNKAPSEDAIHTLYNKFYDTLQNNLSEHIKMLEKHVSAAGLFDLTMVMTIPAYDPLTDREVFTKEKLIESTKNGYTQDNIYENKIISVEYNADGTVAIVKDITKSLLKMRFPNPYKNQVVTITFDQETNCTTEVGTNEAGVVQLQKSECFGTSVMDGGADAQPIIDMIIQQKRAKEQMQQQ